MSLMFAALHRLNEVASPSPSPPPRWCAQRSTPAWLLPAALCVVVGAALGAALGAGWMRWRAPPVPAPTITATSMSPLLAVTDTQSAFVEPQPEPEPEIAAAGSPHAEALADTVAVAAPKPAPVRPAPTATPARVRSLPAGSMAAPDASSHPQAGPGLAGEPDAQLVAGLVQAIGQAIGQADFEAAQQQLTHLQTVLPARSLTLLRLQAWLAQSRGDAMQALPLYREIATRMPGDRGAAINLALLEAGNGQLQDARERLRRLQIDADAGSDSERQALALAAARIGAGP